MADIISNNYTWQLCSW